MRTTLPRRAAADSGGELSHARAQERPTRIDGVFERCGTFNSSTQAVIGAPIAVASTVAAKSLLAFIDECPLVSERCCRAYTGDGARHTRAREGGVDALCRHPHSSRIDGEHDAEPHPAAVHLFIGVRQRVRLNHRVHGAQ
jgi:hypothetical protein